ncbi:MAG: hypothetical protein II970_09040, partial [Paludibacteraceae bacterium]|nr:hypothetical protein [Paludibacteraceae bacterium]
RHQTDIKPTSPADNVPVTGNKTVAKAQIKKGKQTHLLVFLFAVSAVFAGGVCAFVFLVGATS